MVLDCGNSIALCGCQAAFLVQATVLPVVNSSR